VAITTLSATVENNLETILIFEKDFTLRQFCEMERSI
jgi:hypothetical protein